jgi:hypothetical protein
MSRVHISLLLVMIGFVVAMPPANAERLPLPEVESSDIEYPNVAVAWSQLSARDDVEMRLENGWPIVVDHGSRTVWSFSPPDYPAYPAVVKRQVVPVGNKSDVRMSILCEASKEACDDLAIEFRLLLNKALSGKR